MSNWSNREVYFSIDIEADGPIPGQNSMLSLGVVPIFQGEMIDGGLEINFELLPKAMQDAVTMKWWKNQKGMYERTRENAVNPIFGMQKFNLYIEEQLKTIGAPSPAATIVGYPVFFDYLFVYWYQMRFARTSPTSFSALDMKTLAMVKLGKKTYKDVTKRSFKSEWKSDRPHTHGALDDALEQGDIFIRMINDNG